MVHWQWYRRSIKNKVLASVFLVFALIYVPTLAYIYRQARNDLFDSARLEGLSTAKVMAVALYRNYEIESDERKVQSFIVGAKRRIPALLELSVLTPSLNVVSSTNTLRLRGVQQGAEYRNAASNQPFHEFVFPEKGIPHVRIVYPISAALDKTKSTTGVLELKLDIDWQLQKLTTFRLGIFAAAMILILATGIVLIRISESITKPIRKLYEGMSRANEGDLSVRVDIDSEDEVGYATETFNEMLTSIQESNLELRENARTMKNLNTELRGLATRLKDAERLEVIGTLTSVIAHQLKNPLSIIRGALASVRRRSGDLSSDVGGFLDILDQESERTHQILERFLEFAKKQNLVRKPVRSGELLSTVLDSFQHTLEDVTLERNLGKEVVISADRELISEVILNVLENARDALSSKELQERLIRVSAHVRSTNFQIEIEDSGPGVDEGSLEQVFEPFFSTKAKGTGLGLSIARKILTLHGGTLTLSNRQEEGGTSVMISLPIESPP